MFTLDAIVAPHPLVVGQVLPTEAVLLVPNKGEVKVLNDVGARIWTLLNGERTLGEIVDLICTDYAVECVQAEHDALTFIHELAQRDLVLLV